jgi:uncharacterized membrane protein HdeD (DUF308 family)
MATQQNSSASSAGNSRNISEDDDNNRGTNMFLGVLLTLAGVVVLGTAVFSTILTAAFIGWLALIGGVIQFITSFFQAGHRFRNALLGILYAILGVGIIAYPLSSLAVLTLALAVLLTITGLIRLLAATTSVSPTKGLDIFSGLVTLILGVLIWIGWPASSLYVLGLFLGIDLLVAGIALMVTQSAEDVTLNPI